MLHLFRFDLTVGQLTEPQICPLPPDDYVGICLDFEAVMSKTILVFLYITVYSYSITHQLPHPIPMRNLASYYYINPIYGLMTFTSSHHISTIYVLCITKKTLFNFTDILSLIFVAAKLYNSFFIRHYNY